MREYARIDSIPPSRDGTGAPVDVYNTWPGFRACTRFVGHNRRRFDALDQVLCIWWLGPSKMANGQPTLRIYIMTVTMTLNRKMGLALILRSSRVCWRGGSVIGECTH